MKIVTWNCNGGFHNKFQSLDDFDADIVIIQECRNPHNEIRPKYLMAKYQQWIGSHCLWEQGDKLEGIGIFPKKGNVVKRLHWDNQDLQYGKELQTFLPCIINDSIILIAVWSKEFREEENYYPYAKQIGRYLDLHKSKLMEKSVVICGDFNSNGCKEWENKPKYRKEENRDYNHSHLVEKLKQLGLKSIYHWNFDEEQGCESKVTWYGTIRGKLETYYIDHVFASEELLSKSDNLIYIEDLKTWAKKKSKKGKRISDHIPVVFQINS